MEGMKKTRGRLTSINAIIFNGHSFHICYVVAAQINRSYDMMMFNGAANRFLVCYIHYSSCWLLEPISSVAAVDFNVRRGITRPVKCFGFGFVHIIFRYPQENVCWLSDSIGGLDPLFGFTKLI
ncbi:hypothetical protein ANN_02977 [Periplaneta americana]|uniref:Uncharacterized protein n=1 Tax=Periplaneta americana TaxID=6978 RepID=A0ABQ8TXX7_PERAM|nr:hypothetical protein ANN_02977 [Periplaneta americana]